MAEETEPSDLQLVAEEIYATYAAVASGQTDGGGGTFYADGKGTLNAVTLSVEVLEALAKALGKPVYGRTNADRYPKPA